MPTGLVQDESFKDNPEKAASHESESGHGEFTGESKLLESIDKVFNGDPNLGVGIEMSHSACASASPTKQPVVLQTQETDWAV